MVTQRQAKAISATRIYRLRASIDGKSGFAVNGDYHATRRAVNENPRRALYYRRDLLSISMPLWETVTISAFYSRDDTRGPARGNRKSAKRPVSTAALFMESVSV